MLTLEDLLQQLMDCGGSDLHISAGSPPRMRVDGSLTVTEHGMLDPDASQRLIYSVLDSEQIARFERDLELDFSFGLAGLGRFRANVFWQRGAVASALRVIPFEILSADRLGLPTKLVEHLCTLPRGLVLVTGATGSGKSTTLASMIDYINRHRKGHIITIEDPIEFVHRNKNCLVNQREVGTDTRGFSSALRYVLRQDPDVVLIGEMRDHETIEAALTLAETGHLTFASLHTSDVVQTVNRIIDVFSANQQAQIRTQLSFVLQAVFCQTLLPRLDGHGRAMAAEILVANSAVRSLIREDRAHQLYSIVQTGGKTGMKTMNQALYELYRDKLVTYEQALSRSSDPDDLKRVFQRVH